MALISPLQLERHLDLSDIVARRSALEQLLTDLSALARHHGHRPSESSPATADLASATDTQAARTVQGQTAMLLGVAADHISATAKLLYPPFETVAPWACARAVLETSAIVVWLLDPAVASTVRLGRGVVLRHEGIDQQLKYARSAGADAATLETISRRIGHIAQQAANLRVGADDPGRKRRRPAIQMPSTTFLVRDMLDQEDAYRLISAIVHAHNWAISQVAFQESAANRAAAKELGFATAFEKTLKPLAVAYLCVTAARAFSLAVWRQWQYMGWPRATLEAMLEVTFDRLDAREDHRFWRTRSA